MPTKLKIIKDSSYPLPDIKPNFGKLVNLHLELLENKKKLKPNLPIVPIKKQPVKVNDNLSPPEKSPRHESKSPQDIKSPQKSEPTKPSTKRARPLSDDEGLKELYASDQDYEVAIHDEEIVEDVDLKGDSDIEHIEEPHDHDDEEHVEDEHAGDMDEEEDDGLTPEEREEKERQEILVKFRILKRGNKDFKEFPDYTEHTPTHSLKQMYNETLKIIQLEQNVDSYKNWLRMGFFGFEIAMIKLGVHSFKGFCECQMQKIDKYDKMLIELGERSYTAFTNNWPIEVRLIGVFLMDACIFYLGKIVTEHMGGDMATAFASMMGIPLPSQKKVRMRGPRTTPEDIHGMTI